MGPLDDANAHLAKAREFYDAAEANAAAGRYNVATSDAVISGINAKDAICLKLTGRTGKADNHAEATAELKAAGKTGAAVATTLSRLLSKKTQSQYQTRSMAKSDAETAVKHAAKILTQAEQVVGS